MPRRRRPEQPETTHYIADPHTRANLKRLTHVDRLVTRLLGGLLPEQADPAHFHRVLDIGCGPGCWLIDLALAHPTMSLVGIDIDTYILNYAYAEAVAAQVSGRVEFRVMDALRPLEFPSASFDLVNMRMGSSFLRTWEWPHLLKEIARVLRPQGVVRLVEMDLISQSSSESILHIARGLAHAFFNASHFFGPTSDGLTAHLERLLQAQCYRDIQMNITEAVAQAGTSLGQDALEYAVRAGPLMRPFVQKWRGGDPKEYDSVYQQLVRDIRDDPNFYTLSRFVTVLAKKAR